MLGYRAKFITGILAVFTLITALGFHFELADQNQFIHFFKNCAIAGGLIQIVARGAGPISIDARS